MGVVAHCLAGVEEAGGGQSCLADTHMLGAQVREDYSPAHFLSPFL